MAARLRLPHQQEVRDKIRASQLVNRLESHVLDGVEMTTSQVTAGLGLLRKCIPDISESKTEVDVGDNLTGLLRALGRPSGTKQDDPPLA